MRGSLWLILALFLLLVSTVCAQDAAGGEDTAVDWSSTAEERHDRTASVEDSEDAVVSVNKNRILNINDRGKRTPPATDADEAALQHAVWKSLAAGRADLRERVKKMVLEMSWKRKRSRQQQRYQQEETQKQERSRKRRQAHSLAVHKLKLAKDVRKYKEADQDSAKNTAQQLKHIRKQHMKMLKMLARENRDWRQHVIKVKRKAVQRRMKGKEKEAKAAVEARHKAVAQTTYRRQAEVLQKRGDELRAKREQSAKSRERVLKRQASEQHKKTMESRKQAHHAAKKNFDRMMKVRNERFQKTVRSKNK